MGTHVLLAGCSQRGPGCDMWVMLVGVDGGIVEVQSLSKPPSARDEMLPALEQAILLHVYSR